VALVSAVNSVKQLWKNMRKSLNYKAENRVPKLRINNHEITDPACICAEFNHYFIARAHTHTHTHFNGPFSGTTRVSQYQKGKTNLDFTEARESEWQRHQLCHMQVCTSLQTDNHASTSTLSFLQTICPSCRPTNSVRALKALLYFSIIGENLVLKQHGKCN